MKRKNKFIDIYRACNNGSVKEKYDLIKSSQLSVPRYLDIELTNKCNFICRFCPTGTHTLRRAKGFMPENVVEAILESVEKYKIPAVRFIRWGEPTLHPKYLNILEKFKNIGGGGYYST